MNPGHPAAPLYPQEVGFLLGSGGFQQSKDDSKVVVRKDQTVKTPVSEYRLLGATVAMEGPIR